MNVNAYIECPECGESATIDFQRKRGTVMIHCGCQQRRELIPSYDESVVVG